MTSLESVVGFAELAKQMQKRSAKKGFDFTLMVVGESGLGKSTMINSLFLRDLYSDRIIPNAADRIQKTVEISTSTVDIEENGVRLRLTIVDTPGFSDAVNNDNCWSPIIDYIDRQYETYLRDESGLNRRNIVDNRIHSCLYFISPSGHGLKPLDIAVMKKLDDKVNIIPVIGKADMLTKQELQQLKKKILAEIRENGIRIYSGGETDEEENQDLKKCTPFAVVSSNQVLEVGGKKVRGRLYPWGVVEVENPKHSEFPQLRNILMRTHMQDLKEVTVGIHYENYRSGRLAKAGRPFGDVLQDPGSPPPANPTTPGTDDVASKLAEKEQELERMRMMMDMMRQQMQQQGGGGDQV